MRVLAIDSSGLTATVAIVEDDQTIAEYTTNYKKTHSQTLLPMIDEMVKMVDADLASIDAIAVSGGPGSFTGLRIGSATAKGLGLALDKPLIHVPTVEAMAYSMYGCEDIICPIMDARRKQVYTGLYSFAYGEKEDGGLYDEPEFRILRPQAAVAVEELIRNARFYAETGGDDAIQLYESQIQEPMSLCLNTKFQLTGRGEVLADFAKDLERRWSSDSLS